MEPMLFPACFVIFLPKLKFRNILDFKFGW